jgi:hypothetical protein
MFSIGSLLIPVGCDEWLDTLPPTDWFMMNTGKPRRMSRLF